MAAKGFSIIQTFKMRKLRQMTKAISYSALPQSQSVFKAFIKSNEQLQKWTHQTKFTQMIRFRLS